MEIGSGKPRKASVEVSEQDGVRSLHLGSDTVQSSMKSRIPYELVLSYTRAMMAFLLFRPQPASRRDDRPGRRLADEIRLPPFARARTTVIEIRTQVSLRWRASISMFRRTMSALTVEIGEGGAWVCRRHPECCDVLMVDGLRRQRTGVRRSLCRASTPTRMPRSDRRRFGGGESVEFRQALRRLPAAHRAHVRRGGLPAGREDVATLRYWRSGGCRIRGLGSTGRSARAQLEKLIGLEFPSFVDRLKGTEPAHRKAPDRPQSDACRRRSEPGRRCPASSYLEKSRALDGATVVR